MNNTEKYTYLKKIISNQLVMPYVIELHPTNFCNQECIWCIMREQRKNQAQLSHHNLEKIAIELKNINSTKHILLSGGGEPLVNECLFDEFKYDTIEANSYFEFLKKLCFCVEINSNGERLQKLIDSDAYKFIDALRISIDAGTETQYKKLHRSKSNIRLIDIVINIEKYYKVSNKKVEISYLSCEHNEGDYSKLAHMFNSPEAVSRIIVKQLIGSNQVFTQENYEENGIRIDFSKPKILPKQNFSTHANLLINALGNMYPCCHAVDLGIDYCLGNINETSIEKAVISNFKHLDTWNCDRCATLDMNVFFNEFNELEGKINDRIRNTHSDKKYYSETSRRRVFANR